MNIKSFTCIEQYMQSCLNDSAHDAEHVRRVLNNALIIAESVPKVDYDVLIAACLLHDIARPEQVNDPAICHAEAGSAKAYGFLVDNGFSAQFAEKVSNCIRTHRFRKNSPPESLEARILFDADKLDVVGAVGVARTLVYRGTVSDPLYSRNGQGEISDGTDDKNPSFFREYKFKLEKLYDRFYTKMGRELALERKAAAANFYNSLLHEVRAFDQAGARRLEKLIQE